MEIKAVEFENQLIITKDNQKIIITPFMTAEPGNIKLGIKAPQGIGIDREEIYIQKRKQKQNKI